MKWLNLMGISVVLILTSYSKDLKWKVNVQKKITAQKGSPVTIDCSVEYPPEQKTNVTFYWKTEGTSDCSKNSKDKKAFIFHPDPTCVVPQYKGKTKLIGDKTKGNCSLQINRLLSDELKIYLRVAGFNDCYSFTNDTINIFLMGVSPVTIQPDIQFASEPLTPMFTTDNTLLGSSTLYLSIFIPLAALFITVVTGIILYAKHKRSQTFTREESGYYINFSRASFNTAKSETSCKTLDVQHPEPKAIDEPIYINTEESINQMSQSMDHNVYANVDYLK